MSSVSLRVRNQARMFVQADNDDEARAWLELVIDSYRQSDDRHKEQFIGELRALGVPQAVAERLYEQTLRDLTGPEVPFEELLGY